MAVISFEKYHGTGNDFVVVDASDPVPDRAAFARAVCDRESGVRSGADAERRRIGADGVLFLALTDAGGDPSRVRMTLQQPDGGTAAMCGNGARCAAAWAAERAGADEVVVDAEAGERRALLRDDGVTVEMGEPTFDPAAVPVDAGEPLVAEDVAGREVTAVNTGVPHAVVFVDDVAAVDLEATAPPLRHADAFPEGANVTVAAERGAAFDRPDDDGPPVDQPIFDQRTYERGVEGETRSCGTGAVAVAAAAKRLGRLDGDAATVRPPGGELTVTVPDDGPATLAGPVEREFDGELPPEGVP